MYRMNKIGVFKPSIPVIETPIFVTAAFRIGHSDKKPTLSEAAKPLLFHPIEEH
jgi:hypothetical protein